MDKFSGNSFIFTILPFIEEFCYGDDIQLENILGPNLTNRLRGKQFIEAVDKFINS